MQQVDVIGFDRSSRSWVTKVSEHHVAPFPKLDGVLLTDEDSLNMAADDFGHLRHLRPIAVLEPASPNDVIKTVGFANEYGIKIAARGRGHSAFGQSQVEAGIQIRMGTLHTPLVYTDDAVQVPSGMSWIQVLAATLQHGLRPPVITQSPEITVGGTLSVGGVDGGSYRYGAQVDNVLELEIVTGEGRVVTCSADQEPELFNAVLSGLGQCGVILTAKLRLIPAETHARVHRMTYPNLSALLHDARLLVADGRFDRFHGRVLPSPTGKWMYILVGAKNFNSPAEPDTPTLLKDLNFIEDSLEFHDFSYYRYADRSLQFAFLRESGRINLPHPWFQVLASDAVIDQLATEVLEELAPGEFGDDLPVEIFSLKSENCMRPLFRLPDSPVVFGLGAESSLPKPENASQLLERNRRFYERARGLGCKIYPVCAIPFTSADWQDHYDPFWEQFSAAKRCYDPNNILAPGPEIFK